MNKKKHLFLELQKQVESLPKLCYINGCNELSDFNHLLQKKGILNQIEENKHIYILSLNSYYDSPIFFEKKGINKTFGYRGFCNKHDNNLFKPIETISIDYNLYNNQLLFSIRAFYNQRNKKERLYTFYLASKSNEETKDIIPELHYKESMNSLTDSLNAYQVIENKLFNDYNLKSENFHFRTIHLPRTEVCISSVYTFETTEEIIQLVKTDRNYELTNIFINFFPTNNESILIIGIEKDKLDRCSEHLDKYLKKTEDVLKLISDNMLTNIEDWVTSPKFYREKIKPRESEIIELIKRKTSNEREELDINLFENTIKLN